MHVRLMKIPVELGKLEQLEELNLSENLLEAIPSEIALFFRISPSGSQLSVHGNWPAVKIIFLDLFSFIKSKPPKNLSGSENSYVL